MGEIVIYVLFFFAASISGEQSEGKIGYFFTKSISISFGLIDDIILGSKMVGHSGMLFGRNITIGTIRVAK